MIKVDAFAVLKDGTKLPINYINESSYYIYDFEINIDGENVEFMYYGDPNAKRKWLERDYDADKKEHYSGNYKEARLDFDYIEINTRLK